MPPARTAATVARAQPVGRSARRPAKGTGSPPNRPNASSCGPAHPTQRANSFPKVSNPICRLPLPTFFHQLEAANLGDLLRLWVRLGVRTMPPVARRRAPSDFHGPWGAHQTVQSAHCSTSHQTVSPLNAIPRCRAVKERRKLPLGPPPASPSLLVLPPAIPRASTGMLTGFPVGVRGTRKCRPFCKRGLGLPLRID